MIACLFVEKDSIYKTIPECDCYDIERDAITYRGNYPVIAHPPCQLWGALAHVNYKRWGGDHNRPGNDGGKFKFALDTVRRCGGVLEHPAGSFAWTTYGLEKPNGFGWQKCLDGGWVCKIYQAAYGHRARKITWLYLVGSPQPAIWKKVKGTHQVGFYDHRGKEKNKPRLCSDEANKTPLNFAAYLVQLARGCLIKNIV